jgi:hypothetical protein
MVLLLEGEFFFYLPNSTTLRSEHRPNPILYIVCPSLMRIDRKWGPIKKMFKAKANEERVRLRARFLVLATTTTEKDHATFDRQNGWQTK